ncbi:uncharacterized protein FMAN_03976 [Fusarium mangiferae]|uniref:Uncharacterized protein n=1 Tax=Fusarium mangiferae TaxID=192010 RepID=A0A1L7UEB0_FUSMA|nr:uncharacterized protein FMAN_03976 [Fusarium mangiferae]CVL06037.1 uncharacterized protein FMAN_03976 [Fusarium mangiferae]
MDQPRTAILNKADRHFFNDVSYGRQPKFRFQQQDDKWVKFNWKGKTDEDIGKLLIPAYPFEVSWQKFQTILEKMKDGDTEPGVFPVLDAMEDAFKEVVVDLKETYQLNNE